MKKTLSIFLAALLLFTGIVPAFAAENASENPGARKVNTYTVTFAVPSDDFKYLYNAEEEEDKPAGGYRAGDYVYEYFYVKTNNGSVEYELDEKGEYCYVNGRYMLPSNVLPDYQDQIPPERYSPVYWEPGKEYNVAAGEVVSFIIRTNEKYNASTATAVINGVTATRNSNGEYSVIADRNFDIKVQERDENNKLLILRNHFNVKLVSDEGYRVTTLSTENYHVSYYGDYFDFRVKILPGYTASGIKVTVQRGTVSLGMGDILDEEDMEMLGGIIGESEQLFSYGVDEEGCRLYRIYNITSDCTISVSGVKEESSLGLMGMLKRILRLICNLFGIELDILDSFIAMYDVTVDDSHMPANVSYELVTATDSVTDSSKVSVTTGETVTLIVRKAYPDIDVKVSWGPDNSSGSYKTEWYPEYNALTGRITYSAVYNIDNIIGNTTVVIE